MPCGVEGIQRRAMVGLARLPVHDVWPVFTLTIPGPVLVQQVGAGCGAGYAAGSRSWGSGAGARLTLHRRGTDNRHFPGAQCLGLWNSKKLRLRAKFGPSAGTHSKTCRPRHNSRKRPCAAQASGQSVPKPIPRWDVHFGGLEDDRKDYAEPHITFRSQQDSHRQCGLAICTFHLGFSLVLQPQMMNGRVDWSRE